MKKNKDRQKRQRYQLARARRQAKARKRRKLRSKQKTAQEGAVVRNKPSKAKRRHYKKVARAKTEVVIAPSVFSMTNNPDEVLAFFGQVEAVCRRGHNVKIDLADVNEMTPETIAVFLSRLRDERITRVCHELS